MGSDIITASLLCHWWLLHVHVVRPLSLKDHSTNILIIYGPYGVFFCNPHKLIDLKSPNRVSSLHPRHVKKNQTPQATAHRDLSRPRPRGPPYEAGFTKINRIAGRVCELWPICSFLRSVLEIGRDWDLDIWYPALTPLHIYLLIILIFNQ